MTMQNLHQVIHTVSLKDTLTTKHHANKSSVRLHSTLINAFAFAFKANALTQVNNILFCKTKLMKSGAIHKNCHACLHAMFNMQVLIKN